MPNENEKVERRTVTFEVRIERREDKPPVIHGYAAVFDTPAELFGEFVEVIRHGAFARSIKEDDVRALWNHNSDFVLGRTANGTLSLAEDEHGLAVEITPPDTQFARDRIEDIEKKYVDQMSFGFSPVEENWAATDEGQPMRELLDVTLVDVSPCAFPAYPETSVAVRSRIQEELRAVSSSTGAQERNGDADAEKAQARSASRRRRVEIAEMET